MKLHEAEKKADELFKEKRYHEAWNLYVECMTPYPGWSNSLRLAEKQTAAFSLWKAQMQQGPKL